MFNALEGDSFRPSIAVLNSNTFFRSCVFRGLSLERVPVNPGQREPRVGALQVHGLNATLALENCTLTDVINPLPLVINYGGRVYSDNPDHVVRYHHHQWRSPWPQASSLHIGRTLRLAFLFLTKCTADGKL